MMHEGRLTNDEGGRDLRLQRCNASAAMASGTGFAPRRTGCGKRHVARNGTSADQAKAPPRPLPAVTLGGLLDDTSPMPADIMSPDVLTPGGLLVLGGAPKVGKSDFLISWLVHMAPGVPFLDFAPPWPMRVFDLQAEIQYHYFASACSNSSSPPRSSRLPLTASSRRQSFD